MTKSLITFAAVGIASLGLASVSFAQTAAVSFAATDTDANSEVSLAEAMAVWPDITQEAYDGADSDKSGSLNQAEFDAYAAGLPAPTPVQ